MSITPLPKRIASWTPEPELAGPIPRTTVFRLERTSGSLLFLTVLPIALSLFYFVESRLIYLSVVPAPLFLIMLWKFVTHRRLSKLLVTKGTAARGVVVSVRRWMKSNYKSESRHPRFDYVIAYETPDRREIKLEEEIDFLPVGQTLTVLYLPEAPEKALPYFRCCYEAL